MDQDASQNERKHARAPPAKQEIPLPIPATSKNGHRRPTPTERKAEKARIYTHPRPTARTDDPSKQATEKKPLKQQGRMPPEVTKMQPTMPPPDKQTRKMMESSRNIKRYGNDARKKWGQERNACKYRNHRGKQKQIQRAGTTQKLHARKQAAASGKNSTKPEGRHGKYRSEKKHKPKTTTS